MTDPEQTQEVQVVRLVALTGDVLADAHGKTIYYSLADENVRAILEALRKAFCAPAEAEGKSKADGKAKARTARR